MRYSGKGRPFAGEVPAIDDPRWREWTRPLLSFLDSYRTWPELLKWARANKIDGHFLRHQLAWLEDRKLAGSKPPADKKDSWIWYNANVSKRRTKKKRVSQDPLKPLFKRLAQKALRYANRSSKTRIRKQA